MNPTFPRLQGLLHLFQLYPQLGKKVPVSQGAMMGFPSRQSALYAPQALPTLPGSFLGLP